MGDHAASATSFSAAAAVARRSQTACTARGCTRKMKTDDTPLTVCTACNHTHYCSEACQRADWEGGHREECKALIAETTAAAAAEAAAAAAAAAIVPVCGGPGCARVVKESGAPLDVCAGCQRAHYCGKACQTAGWKAGHKAVCRRAPSS